MTQRYYIGPSSGGVPSYFPAGTVNGQLNYGQEAQTIVYANMTALQHTAMLLHLDVIATSDPIDDVIGISAYLGIQSTLEGKKIPGTWLTSTNTYRELLRTTAKISTFLQRYFGLYGTSPFTNGATLASLWSALSTTDQNQLLGACADLGYTNSIMSGSNTLRDILIDMGNQFTATIYIGGPAL